MSTYQDDGAFGVTFLPDRQPRLRPKPEGLRRPRPDVGLARGLVERVSVVLDTSVEDASGPALPTEVLLEATEGTTLLVAAEAYEHDDWRRHDESVLALPDLGTADRLPWSPPRTAWQPAGW